MKTLVALLFCTIAFGQEELTLIPSGTWANDFIFYSEEDDPVLYDSKIVGDTLYLYYRQTVYTYGKNTTCAVYNCTADHSPTIKFRIPYYAKEDELVSGERQSPKREKIVKEVVEYKDEW